MNGFAWRLVLKLRQTASLKWPIRQFCSAKKKNSYTLLSVISKQNKLLSPGFKVLALSFNRIQSSLAVSPRPPALPKGLPLGCLLADRVF